MEEGLRGRSCRHYFTTDVRMYITRQHGENEGCNRELRGSLTTRVGWGQQASLLESEERALVAIISAFYTNPPVSASIGHNTIKG